MLIWPEGTKDFSRLFQFYFPMRALNTSKYSLSGDYSHQDNHTRQATSKHLSFSNFSLEQSTIICILQFYNRPSLIVFFTDEFTLYSSLTLNSLLTDTSLKGTPL